MSPSMSNYIAAYTSGAISRTDAIQINFTTAVISSESVGSRVDNGVLRFSPSINGEATWKSDRTILFEPSEYMPSNQAYVATVKMTKLFEGLANDVGVFEFGFQTKEQHFEVVIEGLENVSKDLKQQNLKGTIYTADVADAENVKKMLSAKQASGKLAVEWEHAGDAKVHHFTISGVSRGSKASEVALEWNGNLLDVKENGNKTIEIPALGDFKLMDASIDQGGGQHILLNFSDPLLAKQNLNGLISISGYKGKLRFDSDGNQLRIYPSTRIGGARKINVSTGIKNINQARLSQAAKYELTFEDIKPDVRLVGKGVIMPKSKGLIFPFEAVNLNYVDIEVFKIFASNTLQFLQTNSLDGNSNLARVGRIVKQKKIPLQNLNPNASSGTWNRYALDLSQMVDTDPNAFYQIRIGFRPGYSAYFCGDNNTDVDNLTNFSENEDGSFTSIMGSYYGMGGYYDGYDYDHRKDPCKPAYYNRDRFVSRNVIPSNLGLVAKQGKDGSLFVAVTDLRTADPIAGVDLELFDYQQQALVSTKTASDGTATFETKEKAFFLIASKGTDKGYLRLQDGKALSLSRFDVAGERTQKGLKGFIYGERGVWRPGDTLHLNFVLEDKSGKLPPSHPVTFELFDAKGQQQYTITKTQNVNNVYNFSTATASEAATGNWTAKAKVGGAVFTKYLKVETVKPNRLKINLDFGKEELRASDENLNGRLQVNWLHGAPARSLKAKVEVQFNAIKTSFKKFNDFVFDDPARTFSSEPQTIFDGNVNEQGNATVNLKMGSKKTAPGLLKANFKTRAFEKGGDFSTDNFELKYHPFDAYAGVSIPTNKYGSKRLDLEKKSNLDFAVVDKEGNPIRNRKVKVGLYRVNWRWWWDSDSENVTTYNSTTHYGSMDKKTLTTNSRGQATWDLEIKRWGRYLVRVCDEETGHCSGDYFYAGYPWSDDDSNNKKAASMLHFTSSKEKYEVGETVALNIPVSEVSKGLLTIENGTKVLESRWFEADKGDFTLRIKATEDWTPNVYAHVTLMQPHAQTENDLPIRMYGVVPLQIEDPGTRLEPVIQMADELKPEQEFTVEVKENNGQAMAYTLAVVDEGLLDLTRFKTPNPWDVFYAREALGVQSWDMFDYVLGAYGGDLERILSIGGDGVAARKKEAEKANRFKPVVKHLGPFFLKKGQKAKHEIRMPNYVGAVRTMVVASNNGAYGSAEKTTPVKKPLMVLATLPRVLGPGESLQLPVNVFAMDKKVKEVTITVESNGFVDIMGSNTQVVSFSQPSDQIVNFDLNVKENLGIAKFTIKAQGGGEIATQEIELDVRNPNPFITNVESAIVESQQSWNQAFEPVGMFGTNQGILEVSNIPPIDLGRRLKYLIRYPHGCIEQTTSSGFPQLYVDKLIELDDKQKNEIPKNIQATVNRLSKFQTSEGGFAYWPGDSYADEWGSNYGGHFILEAKKLGYRIPSTMLNAWKKFQKRKANRWEGSSRYEELNQAYRLYTLALAGTPELGAMNRMRSRKKMQQVSKWRLAAAYALIGKAEVAEQLTNSLSTKVDPYTELSGSYGSEVRDMAMILETLHAMKDKNKSAQVTKDLSKQLSSQRWMSTQTTAYGLLAIGKFVGENALGKKFNFAYKVGNSNWIDAGSDLPMMQIEIPLDENGARNISVKNKNSGILYTSVILSGQPLVGQETDKEENLKLTIRYTDMKGNKINPSRIEQGVDFIAEVEVVNPGKRGMNYEEMALEQIFPSGWEIHNSRMDNIQGTSSTQVPEYQDIRDDRVYTYFDINRNKAHTYRIQLNAAYQGRFYLPTVYCSAMYDNTINARKSGQWVEVISPASL